MFRVQNLVRLALLPVRERIVKNVTNNEINNLLWLKYKFHFSPKLCKKEEYRITYMHKALWWTENRKFFKISLAFNDQYKICYLTLSMQDISTNNSVHCLLSFVNALIASYVKQSFSWYMKTIVNEYFTRTQTPKIRRKPKKL